MTTVEIGSANIADEPIKFDSNLHEGIQFKL